MEAHLQELLDKIRDEGVKEAERQAAHIIREAESKSVALLTTAKKEAEQVLAAAEQKAAQAVERGVPNQAIKVFGKANLLRSLSPAT